MRFVLFACAVGFLVFALGSCGVAKSAIHEIYGSVLLLISALCFVGAAIVDAVVQLPDRLKKILEQADHRAA